MSAYGERDEYGIDVLAFGPHPDDVEIFCGGTLLHLASLDHRVGVIDLTRGERATHGSPAERAKECEAASRILGLSHRENLGFPDTGILAAEASAGPGSQLARAVEAIRRLRPELVLLPWVEERHPDHEAAAALLSKAVFYAGIRRFETEPPSERFAPRQLLYYQLRHRMEPTFVVDTSAVAARKREAIECYASQLRPPPSGDPTLIGSTRSIDAIEARDRYVGSLIGVSHGEALRSPNVPGLVDPLRHFRDNAFPQAHAFEPLR